MTYIVHKLDMPLNGTALDVFLSRLNYSLGNDAEYQYNNETSEILLKVDSAKTDTIRQTIAEIAAEISAIRYLPKKTTHNNLSEVQEVETPSTEYMQPSTEAIDYIAKLLETQIIKLCSDYISDTKIYPSLISLSAMDKCKYLHKFPQNAYVVEQFPHDYSVLKNLSDETDLRPLQEPSGKMLSPATCFHCYEELSDKIIDGNVAILARSRCFRHESTRRVAPHRLTEFNMMELIFVGDKDYAIGMRSRLIEHVWDFFIDLGLKGLIESAADPFYFPQDGLKVQYQLLAETKFELIAQGQRASERFAVGSFNYVSDSLCKSFNIQDANGQFPHSGCVAFGIERLALSLFYRHGEDPAKWPESLLSYLAASGE